MESVGTDSSGFIKVLLIVVIVILFIWLISSGGQEHFDQDIRTVYTNPIEYKQTDIPVIKPPVYDSYSDTIQAGSEFIPQKNYFTPWGSMIQLGDMSTADGLANTDPNGIGDYTLNFNQCSPACCSDQWPVPFKMPVDKMLCNSEDEFVPTSYYCNNGWQNSGCLCLRKDQNEFLQTRGLNSDF